MKIDNRKQVKQGIFSHRQIYPFLVLGLAFASNNGLAMTVTSYTLTDLTTVSVGGFIPGVIRENGTILGTTATPVITNNAYVNVPQIYDIATGSITKIDTLANGDTFASVAAINASGQALGQVLPATSTTGISRDLFVRNADASVTDLGMFSGSMSSSLGQGSYGIGISDTGKIVGITIGSSLCDYRSFVGDASGVGGLTSLGSLGGGTWDWTQAVGMNATTGQIVGRSTTAGACLASDYWHAFVSTPTGLKDLQNPNMPLINPGNGGSVAYAVNIYGMVAGQYPYTFGPANRVYAAGAPLYHAVIWDSIAGTYTDLGKPNAQSYLKAINASGLAVGAEITTTSTLSTINYAVIGDVASGALINLNTLVTNLPTGWKLASAYSISDVGQILVSATDTVNATHYALLTPTTSAVIAPTSPSSLTSTAVSSSQITLTWKDNANNETGQILERCQGVSCTNFTPIATLAANVTSYINPGLIAGTSYSYRIIAQGTAGNSAYSNITTATTAAALPDYTKIPYSPTKLTSSFVSNNQIGLSWVDNSNNETKFLIERCRGSLCFDFKQIASVASNVTAYTDNKVAANTWYNYRVKAANLVGTSAFYTNVVYVKTLP